ncbi:MAG: DUF4386 domain-containing protein [Thermoleophilia bacterium]
MRGNLIVDGDAAATAENIDASPGLFGVGIAADLVMIALDVMVAIGLFQLLRHVDRRLAMTTTVLRLVQGAVIAVNLVNLVNALGLARDAVGPDGAILIGPAQDALDAVERHALGYDAGLIAFGLSCLVLSRLLFRSGAVPRLIAVGMGVTGVIYLAGSTAALFASNLSGVIEPLYLIPLVVELSFAVLLVTRGLNTRRPATTRPVPATA